MIGLVFNVPPDEGEIPWNKQYKNTTPRDSFWLNTSRVGWTKRCVQEWIERLQYQRKIEQPTGKKETPSWAKRKTEEQDPHTRIGPLSRDSEDEATASTGRDDTTD